MQIQRNFSSIHLLALMIGALATRNHYYIASLY